MLVILEKGSLLTDVTIATRSFRCNHITNALLVVVCLAIPDGKHLIVSDSGDTIGKKLECTLLGCMQDFRLREPYDTDPLLRLLKELMVSFTLSLIDVRDPTLVKLLEAEASANVGHTMVSV